MSTEAPAKKLVVLTADRNAQFAVRGLLSRHRSLGFHPLPPSAVDYVTHPERVGLGRCTNRALVKLKRMLQSWFPET